MIKPSTLSFSLTFFPSILYACMFTFLSLTITQTIVPLLFVFSKTVSFHLFEISLFPIISSFSHCCFYFLISIFFYNFLSSVFPFISPYSFPTSTLLLLLLLFLMVSINSLFNFYSTFLLLFLSYLSFLFFCHISLPLSLSLCSFFFFYPPPLILNAIN